MTPNPSPAAPRRRRLAVAALLATTILAGGGLASSQAWSSDPQPVPSAPASQPGFADLVAKVKPAVVNIATTEGIERTSAPSAGLPGVPPDSPLGQPFQALPQNHDQDREGGTRRALGSGFIVDPAGYIVTNNHVVDHARTIMVTLDDGSSYPATVTGRDPKTDLALLKIDAKRPLPAVAFGNSEAARVGDWVIAVGNPFGLGGTVTAGIVSAHGRTVDAGPYDDFLQIDAPINPGNSGGPLFDQSGHVVGIDTAIFSPTGGSVGIGFAIPSNLAARVVAQLRDHGSVERGWLGVQMQPLTPALAKAIGRPDAVGVLVDQVEADSPAARAKLQAGDIITAFNGTTVKAPRDLALAVADLHAGQTAKVDIWRDGAQRTLDVTVGNQPAERTASLDDGAATPRVGLALAPLSPESEQAFGLDGSARGAVVARVVPGSQAEASGVQPGDVIVKVGRAAVSSPSDVVAEIRAAEHAHKDAVPLLVMRDGKTYYLALELKAA